MNKENKKKALSELVSILSHNSTTIYLIDMSELNSNQISFLRKSFYKYNIKMRMIKNTLLKRAINEIENKKFDSFFPILNGNTTILFSSCNVANVAAKIIKNFHIKEKTDKPYLKGAYAQEFFYFGGNKDLNLLFHLKSKEDFIIEIFKLLQFPIKNILSSLLNSTKFKICEILETLSSTSIGKKNKNYL
ncbi:50S ribosomal protein L10 [Blattabacterium cuenoti]|uniref:50S ribosomal protein L10 n=1 Tax=Blattabacterium cuenoti TaxID=1653831 RepID=UPI00163BF44D|nr:50S ribosomal protein L10 [Blattabacterium cuenoti]